MVTPTSNAKLTWQLGDRTAKLTFAIPYVEELSLTVEAELPGAGLRQTSDEQKGLALRHANLMLRNLMNALDKGGTLP
jgi:hypothetical protein